MGDAPQFRVQIEGEWHRLPRSILQRVFQRLVPDDYFSASLVCLAWLGAARQGETLRRWQDLPTSIVQRIFQRLRPHDYLSASLVCLAWLGAAMEDPAVSQLPLLLFLSYRPSQTACFHSLTDHRRYEMDVAELNAALCRGASHGCLLFEERGGIVCIYNLNGVHIYLPTHKTRDMAPLQHLVNCTPAQRRYRYPGFTMAVMSSVPSDPSCTVAAIVGKKRLVMCRLANMRWVLVADYDKEVGYLDLAHHGDCFYALEADNSLTVFEAVPNPSVRRIEAAASCAGNDVPPAVDKYLIESLGELLLVENTLDVWNGNGPIVGPSNYARVFKLDKHRPRWIPVLVDVEWSCSEAPPAEADMEIPERTLTDNASDSVEDAMKVKTEVDMSVRGRLLVLGRGTSRSLPSDGSPDVTLDMYNRIFMYSLRTGETTMFLPKRGCDRCSPPIWVTPIPRWRSSSGAGEVPVPGI